MGNLNAQNNFSEPLQLNKNFLVNSAGLPEEYLLFVQDSATQILFNPAIANNFTSGFIYVNYLSDYTPQYFIPVYFDNKFDPVLHKTSSFNFPSLYTESFTSSKNPTFSAAALININGAKWLFEVTNGLNRYKNLNNSNSYILDTYNPSNNYERYIRIVSEETTDDEMTTSLKVSRIFQSGEMNYSVGLYGIINKANVNSLTGFDDNDYRYSINSDGSQYRTSLISNICQNDKTNNSRYVIGGEFTINHEFWDYLVSADYQFGDNSQNSISSENYVVVDSAYQAGQTWSVFNHTERIDYDNRTSQEPAFFNISNYFRHLINLITPGDNIFLSLNLFFSAGEISYKNLSKYFETASSGGIFTSDSSQVTNTDKADIKNLGTVFSAVYAISKNFSDLFVLSGIRFSGRLEQLEDIDMIYDDSNNLEFAKSKSYPSSASFTLPLYLNYTAAEWVSVYGGINYSYTYFHNKHEYNYMLEGIYDQGNISAESNQKADDTSERWQSYKSLYAGCELRHSSGLKIQFFFDDDIASIRNWNFSVGYHF